MSYVSGSARTRELVLQDPRLFLRVQQEAQAKKAAPQTPEDELVAELGALGGIACRLHFRPALRQPSARGSPP